MLAAARSKKAAGGEFVIVPLESHDRPEVEEMAAGMEIIHGSRAAAGSVFPIELDLAFHTAPGMAVALADCGPGIETASLPRAFDKFYRAPSARTGGTGLGLSRVKGFVEAPGGRITAENQAEGGVTFAIYLPLGKSQVFGAAGRL